MESPDDVLSLPSEAGTASEDEPIAVVQLPSDSHCCDADCLDHIAVMPDYKRKADEIRQAIKEETGLEKRNEFQFQVLRTWVQAGDASKSQSQ